MAWMALSVGLALGAAGAWADEPPEFDTLEEAYAAAGFDPRHPSNAVVVFFSDPHMNLWEDVLPISTNLDPRLVQIVNAMDPPPRKVIVAGDTSTTLSPVPGWVPRAWSMEMGTNEMLHWLAAIRAFTNVAPEDIVWIPGNHDQLAFEEEAATYRLMYPQMPVRQRLDIAGVRFLLLNCGNYGGRNPAQQAWLRRELEQTPLEQPLVVVTHVPPFHFPPWYRGTAVELRELFSQRPQRWWTMGGHYHARSQRVYQLGPSTVASLVVGTANPKNTNGASDDSGFAILCLSNGVHAVLYYSYNRARFELVPPPDWDHPRPFYAAFEAVPGLIWRRLKAPGHPPEVEHFEGDDAVEWYAYTRELRLRIPLSPFQGQATHGVLLALLPSADARVEVEIGPGEWSPVPWGTPLEFVYTFVIPPALRTRPELHVRYTSRLGGNDFIAGWGLVSTSAPPQIRFPQFAEVPDLHVPSGATVTLELRAYVTNPFASYDGQRFRLLSGPVGATVEESTGLFEWRAPEDPMERFWDVTVVVSDTGTPVFSATQSFRIHTRNRPYLVAFPREAVVEEGAPLELVAQAAGAEPLAYRWYFQGEPTPDAEAGGPVLRLPAADRSRAGWYHLELSNAHGVAAGPAVRVGVVRSDEVAIRLPAGSAWHYHDGGEPGPTWTAAAEGAEVWPVGRAPLGYGTPDLRTVLGAERAHPPCTAYFWARLLSPEGLQAPVSGRLWVRSGAVLFWNGREVFRHRMPPGETAYGPWAEPAPTDGLEPVEFEVPVEAVLPGTNLVAVQVHRSGDGAPAVGLWSLNEPEGPWRDAVHWHHFHATGTNLLSLPGRVGNCVSNTGSATSWLETPFHPQQRVRGPFTVGGWVAYGWRSGDDPAGTILERPGEFRLYYTGTRINRFRFRVGDTEVQNETSGTRPGQWRWVVAWFDGEKANLQVDQGPISSVPATLPTGTTQPLRALRCDGPSGGLAADELFYFPRVLTAEERTSLYLSGLEAAKTFHPGALLFDLELMARVSRPAGSPLRLGVRPAGRPGSWDLVVPGAEFATSLWLSTNLMDWIPVWHRPAGAPTATWALPDPPAPFPEFYQLRAGP